MSARPGGVTDVTTAGFGILVYDTALITYTDSTKATISSITFSLKGVTIAVVTLTQTSTTDSWARTQ